ncbi:MerR family transcriptional regulator [Noviherbaspirillum malthae]|uniref:MerR family transcriptional regulator n=1 Tax=Noviherbaspirillum malthae TaxID=1260987 RepID=UPI001E304C6D|nr:MerR family transcriptional regulator [Noviherbaspirillum malthae]
MPAYSISDLADYFSITQRAIRLYEELGLITGMPGRGHGRKRMFTSSARDRLERVLRYKRLGFTLPEIGELIKILDSRDTKSSSINDTISVIGAIRERLYKRLMDIDGAMHDIGGYESASRKTLERSARTKLANQKTMG